MGDLPSSNSGLQRAAHIGLLGYIRLKQVNLQMKYTIKSLIFIKLKLSETENERTNHSPLQEN